MKLQFFHFGSVSEHERCFKPKLRISESDTQSDNLVSFFFKCFHTDRNPDLALQCCLCWFWIIIKGTNFILKYAQVQKKSFKQENAKAFPYFPFSDGFFFSIFENLSSAGSKNRKLNCSGLKENRCKIVKHY